MSKYEALWRHVAASDQPSLQLGFDEVAEILGFEIDHSFLTYKKELIPLGHQVAKISLKNRTVSFQRIPTPPEG